MLPTFQSGESQLKLAFLNTFERLPNQYYLFHPGDLAVLPLVQFEVFDLANVRPHASVASCASDGSLKLTIHFRIC